MNIAELLDAAKRKQGSLGKVADQLGVKQSTLSNWRVVRSKPSATEVALLAEMAGLPVFETLAEVERDLNADQRSVWDRALGNLRAAGVAATVTLGLAIYSMTPNEADAAVTNFVTPTPAQPAPAQGNGVGTVLIMSNNKDRLHEVLLAERLRIQTLHL